MLDRLGTWLGERKAAKEAAANRSAEHEERRAEPRFDLGSCACLTLRLNQDGDEREVDVHNLSTRGAAFRVDECADIAPGTELKASAVIDDHPHPVTLQITRTSATDVGCRIEAPTETIDAIDALLRPIKMGKQLRAIDPRFVQQRPTDDGELSWFQGGADCDVYVWSKTDAVVRTQLFFGEHVVEWSESHGVRSGQLHGKSRTGYAQAETFALSSPPDREALAMAQRILCAADALPDDVRQLARGQ